MPALPLANTRLPLRVVCHGLRGLRQGGSETRVEEGLVQYIAYLRVSTDKQGRSGLGLEAQRKALEPYDVIAEYEEVESGRNNARPQLALALADAKRRGCGLVIAKLDRLARNVHFVSGLLESDVPIVCADMPEADRTMLHMMAVFAEWEARRIGERTREALAAAKARGVKLGSPRPEEGGRKTGAARRARTGAAAVRAWPVIQRLADRGVSSREIADTLNESGIPSANGGRWHSSTVCRLMKRKENISA